MFMFVLCRIRWEDGWKVALENIPMFTNEEEEHLYLISHIM